MKEKSTENTSQANSYLISLGGNSAAADESGSTPCRVLVVGKRRPYCRPRCCGGNNQEYDELNHADVDVADFKVKGWKAQGALCCPVQVGMWWWWCWVCAYDREYVDYTRVLGVSALHDCLVRRGIKLRPLCLLLSFTLPRHGVVY